MPLPSFILCYGHDAILVRTRQQIFERAGWICVIAQTRQEFERCFREHSVDVLVICHSVSTEECDQAKLMAHTQIDPTLILVLDKGSQKCDTDGIDAILDSRQGPGSLVEKVSSLLNEHSQIHLRRRRRPLPAALHQASRASERESVGRQKI